MFLTIFFLSYSVFSLKHYKWKTTSNLIDVHVFLHLLRVLIHLHEFTKMIFCIIGLCPNRGCSHELAELLLLLLFYLYIYIFCNGNTSTCTTTSTIFQPSCHLWNSIRVLVTAQGVCSRRYLFTFNKMKCFVLIFGEEILIRKL